MYCIVLTTTDDKEVAENLARNLVQQRLAACVQIDETMGFFEWDGKLSSGREYRMMIKSRSDHYGKIEDFILHNHNYVLPQIVKLDISGGLPAYFKWIDDTVLKKKLPEDSL